MNPEEAIRKTAEQEGVSVEEVRSEISKAIVETMNNPDPKAQEVLKKLFSDGKQPSPEEFIQRITELAIGE